MILPDHLGPQLLPGPVAGGGGAVLASVTGVGATRRRLSALPSSTAASEASLGRFKPVTLATLPVDVVTW